MLSVNILYQINSIENKEQEDKELAAIALAAKTEEMRPHRPRKLTPYPGKEDKAHQEKNATPLITIAEKN